MKENIARAIEDRLLFSRSFAFVPFLKGRISSTTTMEELQPAPDMLFAAAAATPVPPPQQASLKTYWSKTPRVRQITRTTFQILKSCDILPFLPYVWHETSKN